MRVRAFLIGRSQYNCQVRIESGITMKVGTWLKRLGFWGFLFFLLKGLLWLLVPALAVYLAN